MWVQDYSGCNYSDCCFKGYDKLSAVIWRLSLHRPGDLVCLKDILYVCSENHCQENDNETVLFYPTDTD